MADAPYPTIRCTFYVRTQVSDAPTYRYDHLEVPDPEGGGCLHTPYPPLDGDLIHLFDQTAQIGGTYRVVERAWGHPVWSSLDWPYGARYPDVGPTLDIIVESTAGPFRNEAPIAEEASRG